MVTGYFKCLYNEPALCVQLTVLHLNDSIRTYLLSFIHWLPMNQLPWRTIPSDNQSTDQGTGRWVFLSNIHDQTLLFLSCIIRSIIHHLSTLNDYYKCLSWNMYIPTCSCTLLYFLFYLEWYHQLTSQTFTNFQSFNDRISIHVNIFKRLWRFSCIFNALLSLCCGPKHRII